MSKDLRNVGSKTILRWSVRRVMVTTYPDLVGSIRVLEKNRFVCVGKTPAGEGFEEGTIAYALEKPDAHRSR